MALVEWTSELEIGIGVIDGQHRRIVDYINALHEADKTDNRNLIGVTIEHLIDYTYSHFAFEEALMEEAGYEAISIHKGTHQAFRDRVDSIKQRFVAGEQVGAELADLLQSWLLSHIKSDDTSYAGLVKEKIPRVEAHKEGNWMSNAIKRFFGSS